MTNSSPSTSNSDRWNFKAMTLAGRRIWRDCRGSMVIEFALLTPVLLGVFFAIIQFGFIMFTRQEMLYAAREAARSYSVGLNDAGATQALALSLLSPNNSSNPLTFTVTVTEPGGTSGGGNNGGGNSNDDDGGSGNADNGSTSTGDVTVTITVPMAEASLVSFLDDNILSGDIEVSATMFVQGVPEVEEDSGGSGGGSGGGGSSASNSGGNSGGSNNSGSNSGGSNNFASGNAGFRDYINGGNRFA